MNYGMNVGGTSQEIRSEAGRHTPTDTAAYADFPARHGATGVPPEAQGLTGNKAARMASPLHRLRSWPLRPPRSSRSITSPPAGYEHERCAAGAAPTPSSSVATTAEEQEDSGLRRAYLELTVEIARARTLRQRSFEDVDSAGSTHQRVVELEAELHQLVRGCKRWEQSTSASLVQLSTSDSLPLRRRRTVILPRPRTPSTRRATARGDAEEDLPIAGGGVCLLARIGRARARGERHTPWLRAEGPDVDNLA